MEWVNALFALIGVIAVIMALYFASRWLTKRNIISGLSHIKVHERYAFGRENVLMLVSVCGKYMLIGVSSRGMDKLYELTDEQSQHLKADLEKSSSVNFISQLKAAMSARSAKGNSISDVDLGEDINSGRSEGGDWDDKA